MQVLSSAHCIWSFVMSKVRSDEMQLRSLLEIRIWHLLPRINMNKCISSSPFCTPLCIVANIPSLFLLLWCCYRVNISVGLLMGHFRSFSNFMIKNKGIVLAVLQFTRLSVCSSGQLVVEQPFIGIGPTLTRALANISLWLLVCWLSSVKLSWWCSQSQQPVWYIQLQKLFPISPLLPSSVSSFYRSCEDSSALCKAVCEHGGNIWSIGQKTLLEISILLTLFFFS